MSLISWGLCISKLCLDKTLENYDYKHWSGNHAEVRSSWGHWPGQPEYGQLYWSQQNSNNRPGAFDETYETPMGIGQWTWNIEIN